MQIWKIRLTVRRIVNHQITSRKLSVGNTDSDELSEIYRSNTAMGYTAQDFVINPQRSYSVFRITVLSAQGPSPGLPYFQIFTKSYWETNDGCRSAFAVGQFTFAVDVRRSFYI